MQGSQQLRGQTRNIWVGNMPISRSPDTIRDEIRSVFERFGPIENIKIVEHMDCAFVTYADFESAERAFDHEGGLSILGQEVKIGWGRKEYPSPTAPPGQALPSMPPTSPGLTGPRINRPVAGNYAEGTPPPPSRTLWLSRIASSVTEKQIRTSFSPHGVIENIRLVPHKNCAFVRFQTLEQAMAAKAALQGAVMAEQRINIGFGYYSRDDNTPSTGPRTDPSKAAPSAPSPGQQKRSPVPPASQPLSPGMAWGKAPPYATPPPAYGLMGHYSPPVAYAPNPMVSPLMAGPSGRRGTYSNSRSAGNSPVMGSLPGFVAPRGAPPPGMGYGSYAPGGASNLPVRTMRAAPPAADGRAGATAPRGGVGRGMSVPVRGADAQPGAPGEYPRGGARMYRSQAGPNPTALNIGVPAPIPWGKPGGEADGGEGDMDPDVANSVLAMCADLYIDEGPAFRGGMEDDAFFAAPNPTGRTPPSSNSAPASSVMGQLGLGASAVGTAGGMAPGTGFLAPGYGSPSRVRHDLETEDGNLTVSARTVSALSVSDVDALNGPDQYDFESAFELDPKLHLTLLIEVAGGAPRKCELDVCTLMELIEELRRRNFFVGEVSVLYFDSDFQQFVQLETLEQLPPSGKARLRLETLEKN